MEMIELNAVTLSKELDWLARLAYRRVENYLGNKDLDMSDLPPPDLTDDYSLYADLVKHYTMTHEERIVLSLALVPHIKPHALDIFFIENTNTKRRYSEFGGIVGQNHLGFIPTGETAVFLICGDDLFLRLRALQIFKEGHYFFSHGILKLERDHAQHRSEPVLSAAITISKEHLAQLTTGERHKPDYTTDFPAKLVHTSLDWEDPVLDYHVLEEIQDLITWIKAGHEMMDDWGLYKKIKRGYRSLFYGPPGTGKTLTACLIGKSLDLDVYRIDLSMLISKYIGETEKNLANVFDIAEHKQWILFFDEADALFGKRTQTSSSNDRHANQEVAYPLQRIEDFPGIIILASNLKGNIDEAFARRFQSMIYFPVPTEDERLRLWKKAFEPPLTLAEDVDLVKLAMEYTITGGAITNVLRFCAVRAKRRDSCTIIADDLKEGIRKELFKEGKA